MSDNADTTPNKFFVPFLWAVTGLGGLALIYSATRLNFASLNVHFAVLMGMTLILGSRIIVPIPRFSSQISVSDTFVFLIFWLYGGEAALIVASLEAALSTMRFSSKWRTVCFNWGGSALSVFLTSNFLHLLFGNVSLLPNQPISATFIAAICTMALVHYASNSGIVAAGAALKTNQAFWTTWNKHYLWTSITYFAGASAAAVIAALIHQIGFYAFFMTLPIIAIVPVTETLSVMLQVASAKFSRRYLGEDIRPFRRTPLHHHFELGGWSETQVVQRFWLVGLLSAMIGVALALL